MRRRLKAWCRSRTSVSGDAGGSCREDLGRTPRKGGVVGEMGYEVWGNAMRLRCAGWCVCLEDVVSHGNWPGQGVRTSPGARHAPSASLLVSWKIRWVSSVGTSGVGEWSKRGLGQQAPTLSKATLFLLKPSVSATILAPSSSMRGVNLPQTLQIESCPYLVQKNLVKLC
jgi:hypothetical protein